MKIAVSACLLGDACRYDGESCIDDTIVALKENHELVPICPEALGGLSTPRPAAEIDRSVPYVRVIDEKNDDLTEYFERGVDRAIEKAKEAGCTLAIFKSKSPSCGSDYIYDGTFTGTLTPGSGVATRGFREAGIRVVNEHQVNRCTEALFATDSSTTPTLHTERLTLRPITADDAQAIFGYSTDPDVGPNAGWAPHKTIDDTLRFIEHLASDPHVFGIVENETGDLVGTIGLLKDPLRKNPDAMMMGYALAHDRWGRGYMTEAALEMVRYAFEDLGLFLLTCNHYLFNARSKRVIEKCGFTLEGTLRGVEATPDGIMQDCTFYSLSRQEYIAPKNGSTLEI